MPLFKSATATLLALLCIPHLATAQLPLVDKVTNGLEAIAGFWVYTGFQPHSPFLSGGKIGTPITQSGVQGPGIGATFNLAATRDSSWAFKLGVAYTRMTGFRTQDPTMDLRGSIQELPRLAWFAQYHPRQRWTPYFGVHLGLLQLVSAEIYDTNGTVYPIGGNTYEVGLSVGMAANFRAGNETITIFAEPGYTLRNIVSLDWSGGKAIPARFPRSLRFTGWEVAMGVAFGIPAKAAPGK